MLTEDLHARGQDWRSRIRALSEAVWEGHAKEQVVDDWLDGFVGEVCDAEKERYYALCLLQQFIYFGAAEINALLHAMFRDHLMYPLVQRLLDSNPSIDDLSIRRCLEDAVAKIAIVPVGNVSESAAMLTYRLRQEANLPGDSIKTMTEVIALINNSPGSIDHVILTDDFLGSGDQFFLKHTEHVKTLNGLGVRIDYVALVALQRGVDKVRNENLFDSVTPVILLDRSYSLSEDPCVLLDEVESSSPLTREECLNVVDHYGTKLYWRAFGHNDCGVMVAFNHNTPDNTLPIFWANSKQHNWTPVFERRAKVSTFTA